MSVCIKHAYRLKHETDILDCPYCEIERHNLYPENSIVFNDKDISKQNSYSEYWLAVCVPESLIGKKIKIIVIPEED